MGRVRHAAGAAATWPSGGERQEEIAGARPWDLVVIDEAHHARRKDFLNRDQYRPNRLLELLNGTGNITGLKDKTDGLWLATATPMQIDPVEVWDLLKVVGMGGRWGANEGSFLRYFDELRRARDQFSEADWPFVLGMLDDYLATAALWTRVLRGSPSRGPGSSSGTRSSRCRPAGTRRRAAAAFAGRPDRADRDGPAAHADPAVHPPQHPVAAAGVPLARDAEGERAGARSAQRVHPDEAGRGQPVPADRGIHPRVLQKYEAERRGLGSS